MSDTGLWQNIEVLADGLDGGRELSENKLNRLEEELMVLPRRARNEVRRRMILIIAQLSRLEVRLFDKDGKADAI